MLNFLTIRTRNVDGSDHISLSNSVTNMEREFRLGHLTQHVLAKPLKSIVKSLQLTLFDFFSFLANFISNFWFCIVNHNRIAHVLLFINFLTSMLGINSKSNSCLWYDKHVTQSPWLFHQHIAYVCSVADALAEILTCFHRKDALTIGWSLLVSTHTPLIALVNET